MNTCSKCNSSKLTKQKFIKGNQPHLEGSDSDDKGVFLCDDCDFRFISCTFKGKDRIIPFPDHNKTINISEVGIVASAV